MYESSNLIHFVSGIIITKEYKNNEITNIINVGMNIIMGSGHKLSVQVNYQHHNIWSYFKYHLKVLCKLLLLTFFF